VVCLVPFELRYTNYNTQYLYQGSVMATRLQAADAVHAPHEGVPWRERLEMGLPQEVVANTAPCTRFMMA
jgi:hypothetical protein